MASRELATKGDFEWLSQRIAAETRATIAESQSVQIAWSLATVLAPGSLVVALACFTE